MFLLLSVTFVFAQESLWQDYNPYSSNIQDGQFIQVKVNEVFNFSVDGTWDDKNNMSLNLTPDATHLKFLKPSKQTKKYKNKSKSKLNYLRKFNFSVTGILTKVARKSYFKIVASKSFFIDQNIAVVKINGLVNANFIKNNIIDSKSIANLTMKIKLKPKIQKDTQLKLKKPKTTKPGEVVVPQAELSETEKQRYLLKYLKLILGGLN